MKRNHIEDQENSDRWLLTYADLITLLLAFFIVMYSMSRIDSEKFDAMKTQLSGILKGSRAVEKQVSSDDGPGAGLLKVGDLQMIQRKIADKFKLPQVTPPQASGSAFDRDLAEAVEVSVNERGMTIHIKDNILFEPGSAVLKSEAQEVLALVGDEIKGISNHICVEGHTDNLPIKTDKFPSNWELSTARATNVVRFLVEKRGFKPQRISARGFGEFRPLASNVTREGRSKNRRVDVVVLSDVMSLAEPRSHDQFPGLMPADSGVNVIDTVERVSAEPDGIGH